MPQVTESGVIPGFKLPLDARRDLVPHTISRSRQQVLRKRYQMTHGNTSRFGWLGNLFSLCTDATKFKIIIRFSTLSKHATFITLPCVLHSLLKDG